MENNLAHVHNYQVKSCQKFHHTHTHTHTQTSTHIHIHTPLMKASTVIEALNSSLSFHALELRASHLI